MPRRRRVETLSPTEAAQFVQDAQELRGRLMPYLTRLRPQNAPYVAIVEVLQAIDRAETAVTGNAPSWEASRPSTTGFVHKSKDS